MWRREYRPTICRNGDFALTTVTAVRLPCWDLLGEFAPSLRNYPGEVNPRVDLQFCEHLAQVCVHGVGRQEEAFGDLAICEPVSDELGDSEL